MSNTHRHRGIVDGTHRGSTGLWIRASGFSRGVYFAPFDRNPGISENTPDGARVEFQIGEHRGRPVAVGTVRIHQPMSAEHSP